MTSKKDTIIFWMPEWGGFHPMAWRDRETQRDSEMEFKTMRRMVQTAERGKLHGVFCSDGVAIGFGPVPATTESLSRTAAGTRWEPLTLLSALAACTDHIGLLGTVSTSYSEPYNVARMFASLDYISNGRAGWNIVTSAHPGAPANFGMPGLMDHDERYKRSQEFFDITAGLWDSWEDDAFVRDQESGLYFHPEKLHELDYHGTYLSCAGPLNISRPPQGYPVIAQAGSSTAGRAFAAGNADVIYTMHAELNQCKTFYGEVKQQVAASGRNPDHVKILQALIPLIGRDQAHAKEKLARLDALVDTTVGMEVLSGRLNMDLSSYPLDGPVPEVPKDQMGGHTGQKYFLDMAKRDNLTLRQLMQVVTRNGVVALTPTTIVDTIEKWMEAGAVDGFCFTFGDEFESLEIFVDEVVPELQRRGLFHTEYSGTTLRENLGIPRPRNRFTAPTE